MASRAHAVDEVLSQPGDRSLTREPGNESATLDYDASGEGLMFRLAPLKSPMEITGPIAAKIFVSSSTTDADLFLILRFSRRMAKR
jgi:predicted acyl esterase